MGAVFTMSKRERPEAGADGGVVQLPRYTGGQQEVVPEPRRGRSANQQHGEPAAKRERGEETLAAAAAAAAAATTTTASGSGSEKARWPAWPGPGSSPGPRLCGRPRLECGVCFWFCDRLVR